MTSIQIEEEYIDALIDYLKTTQNPKKMFEQDDISNRNLAFLLISIYGHIQFDEGIVSKESFMSYIQTCIEYIVLYEIYDWHYINVIANKYTNTFSYVYRARVVLNTENRKFLLQTMLTKVCGGEIEDTLDLLHVYFNKLEEAKEN